MAREPYLVLRDFRVWFEKRRGFLEALRKATPEYVRAVDGIDLDVGRGEIFCLVGESGCGKTTTGKGILQLVPPTGGDVFVGVPKKILDAYEAAKAGQGHADLETIRRQHSLSWKEQRPWTVRHFVLLGIVLAVAGLIATALPAFVSASVFHLPFTDDWSYIGYGLVVGLLVAYFGSLPPTRPTPRTAVVLGGLAVLWFDVSTYLGLVSSGYVDAGGLYQSQLWGIQTLAMLGGNLFAFIIAVVVGRVLIWNRLREEGLEGIKIQGLRQKLQIIFQDPYASLNPKHSVYDIVAEPLIVNGLSRNRAETEARVEQALADAGLRPPRDFMFRYPHELSGGQRQRVSIAGALVLDPEFLVADEPVSMLDVSIRTEILELLLELREKRGLTYLFITHDLSLAWVLADRIGVMYLGKIVEEGPTRELIKNPRHPYTKALVSVVPVPDPDRKRARIILKGERPDPSDIPAGCRFHPRCPVAFESCGWVADEVVDALRDAASGSPEADLLRTAVADGPIAVRVPVAPAASEAGIRALIDAKAEAFRGLKAIRSMERVDGGLRLSLHEFTEPELRPVSADVKVSCHLFR